MDMSLSKLHVVVMDRKTYSVVVHGGRKDLDMTGRLNRKQKPVWVENFKL